MVSFDARASVADRPIVVSVTKNHDDYASYSGLQNIALGTTMANKSFTFTMNQASDSNAKIELGLGANGNNTVYIDNVVVKPVSACVGGGNLVQNCDFSGGTTAWSCGVGGTAAATCSVVNGEHQTVITSPGAATYLVQPHQGGLALTNGVTYTVSFDARASVANRPIVVSITKNHDDYASYSGLLNMTLGTTMETKSFTFTMSQASDSNAKIELDLGANANNTVYIDNVTVRPN